MACPGRAARLRSPRRRRGVPALALAVAVAALTACGSTVANQVPAGSAAAAGGGGSGLGAGAAAGPVDDGLGPVDGSLDSGATGGAGPLGGPARDPGTAESGPGSAAAPTAADPAEELRAADASGGSGSGRGFTRTEVLIGIGASKDDSAAALAALGMKGIGDPGDTEAQAKAVVDDVNRRGGLVGRTIVLVPHYYDTNEVIFDPNTAAQRACAFWTEDKKVFAVVAPSAVTDTFLACMTKRDTPVLYTSGLEVGRSYQYRYERFPMYYNVGGMLGERFDELSVERLVARKFFSPWDTVAGKPGSAPVKIGIFTTDNEAGKAMASSLTRQLARFGLKPATVWWGSESLAERSSETQNAVLQFRSDGITHVMWSGYAFMTAAEGQNYRPRYFVGSHAATIAANAPPEQMNGAMAEGFIPSQDVSASDYPGHPSPASERCIKVMKDAGQQPTDQTTLWVMQSRCDAFFPLKDALDASGVLSTAGLTGGLAALGHKAQSSITWKSFFGPGENASARAVRDLSYRTSCTCFYYASAQNHVG